jgi:hypothetical protein
MFLHFDINDKGSDAMHKKLSLIDEQTSPLQRIMWVYNLEDPQKRTFENNICTFHIGNGYFLSVAHNLRIQAGYFRSIDADMYRSEIFSKLDGSQNRLMEQYYFTDEYTRKKHLASADPAVLHNIANILKQKRFDTRWVTLAQKRICRSYLVFQFKNNSFYNDADATRLFDPVHQMYDQDARKHTFLVQVELVEAFYGEDIALYRIVDTPKEIIDKIPSLPVNYSFLEEDGEKLYCLQSSPSGPTGRLLNEARIEGMLDHFGIFQDEVGGNYLFEGYRYLIKGYFRFGSSGAPYLFYDAASGGYVVNAIQSEASGIQLSIKNDREGNFQYINAIASPLSIIKDRLEKHLNGGIS